MISLIDDTPLNVEVMPRMAGQTFTVWSVSSSRTSHYKGSRPSHVEIIASFIEKNSDECE